MSKIKVNLDYVPVDGKQISFRAPCASTEAECLVINGVEYDIVDAYGVNIAGTDNVWTVGAVVSVIVDIVNTKAYIQNPAFGPLTSRTLVLEHMIVQNDFFAPVCTDDGASFAIMDDDGNIIVADWFFETEPVEVKEEDPTAILTHFSTGCLYRKYGGYIEWVNPPMIAGVEYRTTKRYLGKPVYTMTFTIGYLSAGDNAITVPKVQDGTRRGLSVRLYNNEHEDITHSANVTHLAIGRYDGETGLDISVSGGVAHGYVQAVVEYCYV